MIKTSMDLKPNKEVFNALKFTMDVWNVPMSRDLLNGLGFPDHIIDSAADAEVIYATEEGKYLLTKKGQANEYLAPVN